ncbi:MAG: SRPBCC family protein [Nocardioides sp.]|uniref:SRPBCC family protein n=1 Tax=Nocardioides sp. TaxID=35761 RepID=UPI0039E616AA
MSAPELEARITIDASAAQLWSMITDVSRMASWSPQVVRTHVFGRPVRLGTRFVNLNRHGLKRWPTTAKVVRFAPHSDFAFRVVENRTVWSFQLAESADRPGTTVVTHRREVPDGTSLLSRGLIKALLGGQERFVAELEAGMNTTLRRLKAEAETVAEAA